MKPLDPILQSIANAAGSAGPSLFELDAAQARAIFSELVAGKPSETAPEVTASDRTIPTAAGDLNIRIYRPPHNGAAATIVFLHGGGYMLGNLDQMDGESRLLAAQSGAVVVAVDYRLAPEHPLPAAHEDAVAALLWANEHSAMLGGDSARLCVAGESAGANLAASAAIEMRSRGVRLAAQLLIVPAPDLAALRDIPEGERDYPMLRPRDIRAIVRRCLPPSHDGARFPFSAARASDLSSLAPAIIGLAGHCPTLPIGRAYANLLREAGNDVRELCFDSMFHPFFAFTAVSPGAKDAAEALIRALVSVVEAHPSSPTS